MLGKGACEVQEKGENQTEGYTISILMMTMMMMMITMIMMMTTNFEIMVKMMMIMLTTAVMMIMIACKQALTGSAAQEGKP